MGVIVEGCRLADHIFQTDYKTPVLLSEISSKDAHRINRLNLDVSTMLAYTSSVTNGSCGKYNFNVPVLAQQAEWECLRPVKPVLDKLFEGRFGYDFHGGGRIGCIASYQIWKFYNTRLK